jgi:surface protein
MGDMFNYCCSLTSLNLSNFNANNVEEMDDMFDKINKDCKLICNDKKILDSFKEALK